MTVAITAGFAAILGLIMIFLSGYVSALRAKSGTSIGDGGDMALLERMRRHGNFVEVVPMALLLMALAEAGAAAPSWTYASGLLLLVGRIIHPIGLSAVNSKSILRGLGSLATIISMLISIVAIGLQTFGG
ncbi:MAG: MAPEG family protein [Rhodobacteraceae bacterium]|nr:MAPEG family protein [Paracoccaceae bacterium]